MRPLRTASLAVALLAAAPCAAADDAASGLESGISSGFTIVLGGAFGLPRGDVAVDGPALDDVVTSRQAFFGELGYRLHPAFRLHLFLQLSPRELVDAACPAGTTCSASAMRGGVDVQVHLLSGRTVDPWLGLAGAVELLDTRRPSGSDPDELRWAGFEAPILLGGVDLQLGRRFAIGPFVSASYAEYTSRREKRAETTETDRIERRARHDWLEAGVRLRFEL